MTEYVNHNEIRVIGMSRSGNHAILQWLIAQMKGRVCFLNCVEGKYNPFWTAHEMDDGASYIVNYPDFDLFAEMRCEWSRKDYFIYSHEDCYLRNACSEDFARQHDEFVGPSKRCVDILILRDPFNLFASRMRSLRHSVSMHIARRIWKQHAKEFLGKSRLLRYKPLFISFNEWSLSPEYRKGISDIIGLEFSDEKFQCITPCHGGSSFDGLLYDGQAEKMKVRERWRYYQDDPGYRSIFDDEMFALSKEIFGHIPGTEALYEKSEFSKAG